MVLVYGFLFPDFFSAPCQDFTFPYFWSDVKWLSSADEDARFIMDNYGKLDDSFVSPVIVDKDGTLLESGVRMHAQLVNLLPPLLRIQAKKKEAKT